MKEKVLIALSDSSLAHDLVGELTTLGYTLIPVLSGPEALEKMLSEKPDLAVIDLSLPQKNGYEVLNEKTLDRQITKIPVIVVSNSGAAIEMRRIPSTPSIKDYVIRTHVEPDEIAEKICKVFGHPFESQHAKSEALELNSRSKKVLWAEDDKFLSNILMKKFEMSGHEVYKAENGADVFKILETKKPDVIVLDILLPGISGFEILQKIHAQDAFKKIPVIMLSNMNKPSDIEKAKMLGAKKFLVKAAVSLDEIIREIEQVAKM